MQAFARITPTWHGVELCRSATLGTLSWWPAVGHVTYLLAWGVAGTLVTRRIFERVLVV
jgi:lipooligosaccharide transport system permease protein